MKYENKHTGYPTIDKPWLQYYEDTEELNLPQLSIYQLARKNNEGNMDKVALDMRISSDDFKRGFKITYGDFFKKIDTCASSNLSLGVNTDEIIPIILPNLPEARELIYANSKIGATSYPISPLLPSSALEQIIKENGIKNLVIFDGFFEKYASVLKNCSLDSILYLDGTESLPMIIRKLNSMKQMLLGKKKIPRGDNLLSWDEYLKLGNKDLEIEPYYSPDHIATIVGTSGTTGVPKGVCMTDDNVNAAALNYLNSKNFEGRFLDALLPSIGYGVSVLHTQTIGGYYTYITPELVTDKIDLLIQQTKPDIFPGGPVHYINLSQSELHKNGKLHKGLDFVSGGASLNAEIEKKMNHVDEDYEEAGVINQDIQCRQGYGLSENVATCSYSKRGSYKFGSIGIPLPYLTVGIFKPDTDEELPYNEHGEICITGDTVMKGYLNNDEETEKVIKVHSDGKRWIHTKDIGYMDENGHLFHVERIKNIFMRTGFNVHPSKISEYINTLPGVQNSHVIGFEHPSEQCVPIAFVQLEDGIDDLSKVEKELMENCYNDLEETSVPYAFVFVDDFPVNVGGKIDGLTIKRDSGIDLFQNQTIDSSQKILLKK